MAFVQNFSIGQNPLNPGIVIATDTSTGVDAAIVGRRIFVQNAYGTYLVPSGTTTQYTAWDILDVSISLDILTQNTSASVTVQWIDVNGAVLYTLTNSAAFADFGKQFLYYLVQLQGDTPTIPADTNYNQNVANLWTAILGGINAITVNNDIRAAQAAFDRATALQLDQSLYF